MIGDCGLHCLEDARQMEVGITLAPASQHQGYATEALNCLLDFAFGTLNAHRISAVTDAENAAAAALFQRLGFRKEAHFIEHRWYKDAWDNEFVFAMLQRQWKA
jgi:RimJ/RimL family protein N-acetyltransferase